MATLDGTDLGDVQSESHAKESGLFNQPLPATDSNITLLLDIFGTSKTITIDGLFNDTKANIRTFIGVIETIQDGAQAGVTFVSDIVTANPAGGGNFKVYIQSFSWSYEAGDPRRLKYSLVLTEAA